LTATDKAGEEITDTFKVTVLNTNDAPTVANVIADQTATEDQAFTLTVPGNAFADVDTPYGDTLDYTAKLASGSALPAWLEVRCRHAHASAARQPTAMWAPSTWSVTVKDKAGERSLSDTFTAHGAEHQRRADAGQRDRGPDRHRGPGLHLHGAGRHLRRCGRGYDDALTYAAKLASGGALPAWLTFDAATRTFTGTPANGDVGAIDVRSSPPRDKAGEQACDTFKVTVLNTNDAPTLASADRRPDRHRGPGFHLHAARRPPSPTSTHPDDYTLA
jgi:hypothetical protein